LQLVALAARVEAALWRRFRFEREWPCRAALFDRYRPLARAIAGRQMRRRASYSAEAGDLEHFAYQGLLEAIDRFDPLKGVPFSAFARRRVLGAIVDGRGRLSEVAARIGFRHRLEQERARALGAAASKRDDAFVMLGDLATALAVGLMIEAGGDSLEPVDPGPSAYDSLAWRETQAVLASAIDALPEREALIVRQHYLHGVSLTQVAALLGLSKGRVSQLHYAALARLRKKVGGLG
jgi:RNA polymerase sigma factor for flagellar operon FliA